VLSDNYLDKRIFCFINVFQNFVIVSFKRGAGPLRAASTGIPRVTKSFVAWCAAERLNPDVDDVHRIDDATHSQSGGAVVQDP
jgi:hypothetical protein